MSTVYIIAIGVGGGVLLTLLVLYRNRLTYLRIRVRSWVAELRATPQRKGHPGDMAEPSRERTTKIVGSRLHRFILKADRQPSLDIQNSEHTKSIFLIGKQTGNEKQAGRQDGDDG